MRGAQLVHLPAKSAYLFVTLSQQALKDLH
jgi:hypothetical protein